MTTNSDDVDSEPGPNSDPRGDVDRFVSAKVRALYDVYSYRHAAAILSTSFPSELAELENALMQFIVTQRDIGMPGGNESQIPKQVSTVLRPRGWTEARISGDLQVRVQKYGKPYGATASRPDHSDSEYEQRIRNFIDGHKIDYVKGRVAFDLEWNSKDQTFDRDLYAMRAFHECGLISVGVMLTRSEKLNPLLAEIPRLDSLGNVVLKNGTPDTVKSKYGASTTWMGKLLYRLNAGRHGGCPVLVLGITPKSVTDWEIK